MAHEVAERRTKPKEMPISAIFSLDGLIRPEHRAAVVSSVLSEFSSLPNDTRNALRAVVNAEITLTTGGFRRGQAGRALDGLYTVLQEPIQRAVQSSDKLASAVLRCWAESQPALQEKTAGHLASRGLAAPGPDLSGKLFRGVWLSELWESEQEAFSQAHDGFDRDDIALMLCYASGNFPLGPGQGAGKQDSNALSGALAYLRELPATAPEWEQEIPNFTASVSRLIQEKAAQLRWSADFDAILKAVRNDFEGLLAFFERDTYSWSAARVSPEADTASALRLAGRLQSLLTEYQPIHERAPGISEERERSRKREGLQPPILETMREIDGLMTEGSGSHDGSPPAEPEPDAPEDATPVYGATLPSDSPQVTPPAAELPTTEPEPPPQADPPPNARAVTEPVPAEPPDFMAEPPGFSATEYTALQSETRGLRDATAALGAENQDLRDEVESLKTELYDTQEMEESWRLAYLSSKEGFSEAAPDAAPEVESVNAAVEMAKERYKRELIFAPNSESNIESNPYSRPEKVWDALHWLATTYYPSKLGRLRVTDFDQSIREACGWWYKGDQGETTLSRYGKSYTTRVDGKRHWLAEHIGKGTSFDARYTIRIAFDWDRERRRVIVGYIGRHQQTDAS